MIDRLKKRYQAELLPNEEVNVVRQATAAGTGSRIAVGAIIGALIGILVAINMDMAALPLFVVGAFAGEAVGYLTAHRAATANTGPGSIHLTAALTNQRLLLLPRYGAKRVRVLRQFSLSDISEAETRQYPIGQLHRVELTLGDGTALAFITQGELQIPVNLNPTTG